MVKHTVAASSSPYSTHQSCCCYYLCSSSFVVVSNYSVGLLADEKELTIGAMMTNLADGSLYTLQGCVSESTVAAELHSQIV